MTVLICLVIKPNSDIAMNPRNIRSTLSLPADKPRKNKCDRPKKNDKHFIGGICQDNG